MIATRHAPHIVFAGGGTGGHLFPGLAVAQRLTEIDPRLRITFAGSGKALERRQVALAGFEYLALRCHPWPRRLGSVLSFVRENLAGLCASRQFLASEPVSAVVGLGGYTSVPMARMAVRQGIPLVLLEQNAVPGRATRWLARRATVVCSSYPQTQRELPAGAAVRLTGNPIRAGLRPADPHGTQLLVLGGSAGARTLNENVPQALDRVRKRLAGWKIIHQTGQSEVEPTRDRYRNLGIDAEVLGFLDDLPAVLNRTALAICRAGGTTLAELSVTGVPAILVPYPHAANDHQRRNAEAFLAAGACRVVDERQRHIPLVDRLADHLAYLLSNPSQRLAMSQSLRRLSILDAAGTVANLVWDLVAE